MAKTPTSVGSYNFSDIFTKDEGAVFMMNSMNDNALRKRSITIAGHRTSLSLEPIFWDLLREEAARQNLSVAKLVGGLDAARAGNLSSTVRVYLVKRLQEGGR